MLLKKSSNLLILDKFVGVSDVPSRREIDGEP